MTSCMYNNYNFFFNSYFFTKPICINEKFFSIVFSILFILMTISTPLFLSHNDPFFVCSTINFELSNTDNWVKYNKLSLNITKTKYMIISNIHNHSNFNVSNNRFFDRILYVGYATCKEKIQIGLRFLYK